MITSDALPTIDFPRIRLYDGTQSGGFEQLAVELFARAQGRPRQLVRVNGAGGDGGVEAYVEVVGKGKLGIQAKFFVQLGQSQWAQIDKSVKTALKQHPDLKEYWVYLPLNRTKGSKGKTEGQLEKWNNLVEAWHKLPNGSDVDFIWQGRSELEHALKHSANSDLLFYWFGAPQFDDAWLDRLLNVSLKTLGERYQPNRHVDANVGNELDRFVWPPSSQHILEEAYVAFAEECLSFTKMPEHFTFPIEYENRHGLLRSTIEEVVRVEYPTYGIRSVKEVLTAAKVLLGSVNELLAFLRHQDRTVEAKPDKGYRNNVNIFAGAVDDWVYCLQDYINADFQCILIRGEAGTGKSHLLAHCAVQARERKQPVLFGLGEQFLDSRPPLTQLCEQIDWNGGSDSLLSALNVAASLAGCPALLVIDALNESGDRRLWRSHLHSVVEQVRKYPHLRLIISCRSDFIGITLPGDFKGGSVPDGWALIEHRGFGDVLADSISRYFASYNVRSPHCPPLWDEFRNPLFLDTFCRAFENQSLPPGPISLQVVMEQRIVRLAEKIQQAIDCDEYHLRQAILALAEKIRANNGLAVEVSIARAAIEPHSPSTERTRSLYKHLLSNGFIVERTDRYWEDNPTVLVRFAFERFADYFIAQALLTDVADVTALRGLADEGDRLSWVRAWETYFDNRGVARALAVLIPEKYAVEFVDILPADIKHQGDVLADLLDSLSWRSKGSIGESTERLILEASRYLDNGSFIRVLLRTSTIPDHPFNASFLHDRLTAMTLPDRDAIWTIPVAELAGETGSLPATLVDWATQVPRSLVSDQQASLVATVLLWFGSSNRVAFRSRAGLAAIQILRGRPHIMCGLVEKFDAVNDPYVVERLYAVACGVAMSEPAGGGLQKLAGLVYRLVFASPKVRPHVLLRDYAQALLEAAANQDCLEPTIPEASFRPPFLSTMPSIIEETEVMKIEEDKTWRRIVGSVRPESMGGYGDFGRYIMGDSVHRFRRTSKQEAVIADPSNDMFEDKLARRWVLQRVKELGWTHELFGEYDGSRHDDRMTDEKRKIERIGKKYQWIALHELLGYLSDHHHLRPEWDDEPSTYQGAWQINRRNFDPSAGPVPRPTSWEWTYLQPYPDPFEDIKLLADRPAWVRSRPADPSGLLTVQQGNGAPLWLVLDGYWSWKEPRILRIRHRWDGRSEMWIHVRSWLVKKGDVEGFLKRIRKLNFWGHGIQGISLGDGWIGEYPWGAVFEGVRYWCEQPDELTQMDRALHMRTACQWDRRGNAIVPSPQLCDLLKLRWFGEGATFVDSKGFIVATQAPLPNADEMGACVVDATLLREGLIREGLEIVWGVVGERSCWNGTKMVGDVETHFSGVYTLSSIGPVGGLTVVDAVDLRH